MLSRCSPGGGRVKKEKKHMKTGSWQTPEATTV